MFDNFFSFLGAWHTKWQNLARSSVIFRASSSTEGTCITNNSYYIFTWSLKLQVVTLLNNKKFCLIGNYFWSICHSVGNLSTLWSCDKLPLLMVQRKTDIKNLMLKNNIILSSIFFFFYENFSFLQKQLPGNFVFCLVFILTFIWLLHFNFGFSSDHFWWLLSTEKQHQFSLLFGLSFSWTSTVFLEPLGCYKESHSEFSKLGQKEVLITHLFSLLLNVFKCI